MYTVLGTRKGSEMSTKVKYNSLEELVYNKLKEMILNKQLKPGEQIIQEQLAKKMGVSRTPLRRVLSQLAKEHLVTMLPRGSAHVREFSPEEIVAIYEIREVLEGLACRKAALLVSKNRLDSFRNLYKEATESAKKGDWKAYEKADEKFHFFLIEASQIDLLQEMVKSFYILVSRYARGLVRPPQETFPEHMAIIDALENHNSELTEKLIREHIQKSIQILRKKSFNQESNLKQ
jgi:DNA-binding GntR family transcriptional regulator